MDSKDEKTPVTTVTSKETQSAIFWDPKQESVWTRVGLTPESFKRAPAAATKQMVAGNADHDVESDSPRLQPKMKKRHLNMIAVGPSCDFYFLMRPPAHPQTQAAASAQVSLSAPDQRCTTAAPPRSSLPGRS